MNASTATEVVCGRCGVVLSVDGMRWRKQGYRVSQRHIDGSPIRGTVSRPDVKGPKLCRQCADAAVARRRSA